MTITGTGDDRPALILPPAPTVTAQLLADAARSRRMEVRILTRRPVPRGLFGRTHLYGGEAFADAVAPELGTALLQPPSRWLADLPAEFTRREVVHTTLGAAFRLERARFIKPAAGKAFPAQVYPSGGDLPSGVPGQTPVLVADPVHFAAEYRLHVLDGAVRAGGRYAVDGVLDPAPADTLPEWPSVLSFAAELLGHDAETLPSAVVVDVGMMVGADGRRELAVVEANEAWFSNCYAADPAGVLDVVLRAALPAAAVPSRDRPFVR
ncbi:ATP-grasp domain-containing protein [Actinomadura scrupuli]|uniref:ATP-grasp domain-containing protein n=1 Tax=Actinomadura scrupuli TaxID=559629 RepID=UPI003D9803F0